MTTQTILLVDDDILVRDFARLSLESMGYQVIVAENGAKGLVLYRENQAQITLVLTDMVMPVMTGWELIAELQKINPQVTCVMMSGYLREEKKNIETLLTYNLYGFMEKPFSIQNLKQVIHDAFLTNKTQQQSHVSLPIVCPGEC